MFLLAQEVVPRAAAPVRRGRTSPEVDQGETAMSLFSAHYGWSSGRLDFFGRVLVFTARHGMALGGCGFWCFWIGVGGGLVWCVLVRVVFERHSCFDAFLCVERVPSRNNQCG